MGSAAAGNGHRGAWAPEHDHDLPLLAGEERPRECLDWEPLLADGIQPALALGAERRVQGPR